MQPVIGVLMPAPTPRSVVRDLQIDRANLLLSEQYEVYVSHGALCENREQCPDQL